MNKLVLFCALACILSSVSAFTLNQQVVPVKAKSARITEIGNRIKKLSNSNADPSQFFAQAAQIQQLQQNGLPTLMNTINQPMLSSSSPMLSTIPMVGGQQNQMMAQRTNNMMPNLQSIQQTISNAIKPTTNQFGQTQQQQQQQAVPTQAVKTQQPVMSPQQILQQQQQLQQQQLQQQVLQQQQQLQQIQQQQQTAAKMSLPTIQSSNGMQQTLQSQIQKAQQQVAQPTQQTQTQFTQPQQQQQQQQQTQQFVQQQPTQTQQFAQQQTQPQQQTQQFTQQPAQPVQQTVQQPAQTQFNNNQQKTMDLEQTLRNFIQQQQNGGQDTQAAQQQQQQQFTQQQQQQAPSQQFTQQTVQQPQQTQQQFVQQPTQTQTQFNKPQTTNVQQTQTQTVQQPSKPTAQFVGPNTFKKTTVNPVKPVVLDSSNIKTQITTSNMNNQQLPSNGVDIEAMCQTKINNERLSHPQNPSQFIICHPFGSIIMECPNHTVYNAALDKCDSSSNRKFTSVCQTTPCQNGGTCTDLSSRSFQCTCPAGFIGSTCEIPDVCTQNNCGPNGICLPMQLGSPVQSYCTCFQNKALGLTCDKNSEPNPCLGPHEQDMHFPTRLGKNMYIQCEGDRPHLKFCSGPLVFHVDKQQCDWETA